MSTTIDPTTSKDTNPSLQPTRPGAALLTGLLAGADRRRDRHLKSIHAAALAEVHIERIRKPLP